MTSTVYLEDVATQITVGHVGSMADEYIEDGIIFLRSLNILPHRIDLSEIRYISESFHQSLRKSALTPGDVVIVRTGKPGTCAVVPESLPVSNCSDLVIVRCGPLLRPRFLAYWVNTIASDHVASHTVGAVQQHFNVGAAKRMPIRLPSIEEQDAILAILGALDDKIEVNRKASATLEAMARALYRSWFVDFDPVWAKLENRPPAHMPPQTAALFPDSFDDDGLPVGWRFGTLADLIEFNPRERIVKGTVAPYFDMRAVPTSGMIADPPIQREFSSGTKFRSMDTLLARITPCLENGKTAMVPMMGEQEVAWGSTEFIVMRPRSGVPASLPYCVARDTAFRDEAIATMTGSSGRQRADAISISELPAAIAGVEVLSEFGDATMPLIDRIHAMGCENQTLATLRDSLLPRLMSGEIRVGDAQNLLKETI